MRDKLLWGGFFLLTILLLGFFLFSSQDNPAGDIVEYFGVTESLINHRGVYLSVQDQSSLEASLNPGYFKDPTYYIEGRDGRRYPVHFIFYSVIAVPIRLFLRILRLNELHTLRVINLLIFSAANFVILKYFLKSIFKKIFFLVLIYFSPLVYFLAWPGVDIYYVSLLLIAVYCFFKKRYILAAVLAALASWHSQPLAVIAIGILAYYFLIKIKIRRKYFGIDRSLLGGGFLVFVLLLIPYFYNFLIFGVLSPWQVFQDEWTRTFGLGLQNASFKKLFELFFDLNMGLFWYAPVIFILGFWCLIKSIKSKDKRGFFVLVMILVTAFAYQTNPSWHFGTSGYGPSRHVLYLLPFLIYFIVRDFKLNLVGTAWLYFFVVSQFYILSFNGFLKPNFEHTLSHGPYARLALNNYPQVYKPTPEIFIDRTNHTDLKYMTSAVYKHKGECKKAYVLKKNVERLIQECGFIPDENIRYDMFGGGYVNY